MIVSDFAIAGAREDREKLFARNKKAKGRVGEKVAYPIEWSDTVERLTKEAPLLPNPNPFVDNDALPKWIKMKVPIQSFIDDESSFRPES